MAHSRFGPSLFASPIVMGDPAIIDSSPLCLLYDDSFLAANSCPSPIQVNPVRREVLSLALNETTHALRFTEAAARRFTIDIDELETRSKPAISVGYIQNRLSDAHGSLVAAEEEIRRLIREADIK